MTPPATSPYATQGPETAPRCKVCDLPMLVGQYGTHHVCNPTDGRTGHVCSCPPGCTDKVWGDAGTCRPDCIPCATNRGRRYKEPASE